MHPKWKSRRTSKGEQQLSATLKNKTLHARKKEDTARRRNDLNKYKQIYENSQPKDALYFYRFGIYA